MAHLARRIFLVLICLAGVFTPSRADSPASKPVDRHAAIQQWFDDLKNEDPAVRSDARFQLLGISREDLGVLKSIIKQSLPIHPAQAIVLHDMVVHIYLAGETYEPAGTAFIGIYQMEATNCIPGFVAFRMLETGDMIVGVGEWSSASACDISQMKSALVNTHPGENVRITVNRRGELKELNFKLDAKPAALSDDAQLVPYINDRIKRGETYWQEEFAPLLEMRSTPPPPSPGIITG